MDEVAWAAKVKKAFPHGFRAVPWYEESMDIPLVLIEAGIKDDKLIIGGWLTDTKAVEYEVTSFEEKPRGWIVETPRGRVTLLPLTPEVGKALAAGIKEEGKPWA